jgi:hypothetical protein
LIGSFNADMMQRITGLIVPVNDLFNNNGFSLPMTPGEGALRAAYDNVWAYALTGTSVQNRLTGIALDSALSPDARTGNQTAPASISCLYCISY